MTTLVGTQSNFTDSLKALIELDYDAIEAYETAINRLENESYKQALREFKLDHERHIEELSSILAQHGEEAPTSPSMIKQWLAKGKVLLGNLSGDRAILEAMLSNEEDTNTAYCRMNERDDKWNDVVEIIERGRADEYKHKKWLENVIKFFDS